MVSNPVLEMVDSRSNNTELIFVSIYKYVVINYYVVVLTSNVCIHQNQKVLILYKFLLYLPPLVKSAFSLAGV